MSNSIKCIDQEGVNQEFLADLDIQQEQSENENPACKKLVQGIKVARYDDSYTVFFGRSTQTYGLVV